MTRADAVDASEPGLPAGGEARDPTRLTPYLRAILAIVLIADVLDLMDSTITNIAAPSIARQLGGGESLIKWLGAGYALAMGVLLVVGGRLGDRYGKRRIFLIGIAGFTAASALCGLSVDPAMIIVGRQIPGWLRRPDDSSGNQYPHGDVLARAISASRQRVWTGDGHRRCPAGPIAAGFIISANIAGLDWRPVFLINIFLGLIGLVAAVNLLPHDRPTSTDSIDALGASLLGAAMLALILGLIQGSTDGWTTLPILSLVGGIVLFVGFGIRQARAADVDHMPRLLQNRDYAGLVLGLAVFAA